MNNPPYQKINYYRIKVDMIILDYIDCVVPDKNLGDEWKSEGSVMRGFEAMCHELDIAGMDGNTRE